MEQGRFDREELRRAAAAQVAARSGDSGATEHMVRTAQAGVEAGLSLTEIASIIGAGSRDGLSGPGLTV
jgi:hypothetical protein